MKSIYLVLALLVSQSSFAALNLNCNIWNNESSVSLSVSMVMPFTIGGKLKSMPIGGSVMTVIDTLGKDNTLVFNDDLSHLNVASDDGVWQEITDTIYPIKPGTDPLKPKGEQVTSRRLTYTLVMKAKDNNGVAPKLSKLELDVKPSLPGDGTYIGDSAITYNGKSYSKLHTNCSVYIALEYFEKLLSKQAK